MKTGCFTQSVVAKCLETSQALVEKRAYVKLEIRGRLESRAIYFASGLFSYINYITSTNSNYLRRADIYCRRYSIYSKFAASITAEKRNGQPTGGNMSVPIPVSIRSAVALLLFVGAMSIPAAGDSFFFSTGDPDGKIGTLSRPETTGLLETETADDFVLTQTTRINQATFTGLLPTGSSLTNVTDVEIELYHIFPVDSGSFSGHVPTRVNSPSDNQFAAFDSKAGDLKAAITVLNPSFTVANTVVNGIHPSPGQFTGGEGPATGEEVLFTITFSSPFLLDAGHDFFRPEVQLSNGNFLWLSAPRSGAPFPDGTPDLQSWIRNADLSPDWLRIGTDITGQGPFNASFSLSGDTVPEPSSYALLAGGLLLIATAVLRQRRA